jgi:ADP-ribose pyrophosphatase
MQEKTLNSKKIFSGRILNLKHLTVKLPDGNKAKREIIYHPGASAIIPILPGNKVIFVKQYRKAAEKILLEIPAGTLDKNEPPIKCARRELIEETGYKAKHIKKILQFYTAPGYTSEIIHIFLAKGLSQIGKNTEPDEFLKTVILTKKEIQKLYKEGKIVDSKTLIGLSALRYF